MAQTLPNQGRSAVIALVLALAIMMAVRIPHIIRQDKS
jgi:hypothetical protein